MNCNGVLSLQINGTTYFNVTKYADEVYSDPSYIDLKGVGISTVSSGNIINNNTPCPPITDIKQAQIDAIGRLIKRLGIPADVPTYFKGSCNSLVTILWPKGAYMSFPPGGDNPSGGPVIVNLSNSTTTMSIPCNDACCKVVYEYRIRNTSPQHTDFYYQPTYLPADESCGLSPLPNYNSFPHRMRAMGKDSVTGIETIVYGTVVDQEPCELICNKYNAPPPGCFTTNVENSVEVPLEFSANPTLIDDYMKFTTSKTIAKIMVFNMAGIKVMSVSSPDNNELNTAELKQGAYFIQVYFTNNQVKTVKVVKP